jgi:enoyl reductase-like protein
LKINFSECTFLQSSVNYLGHVISEQSDQKKNKVIENYPTSKTISQFKSFIGLASYYRKFITNVAVIAHPFTMLTRKDTPWNWKDEEEKAFQLKKKMMSDKPSNPTLFGLFARLPNAHRRIRI